MAARKKLVIVRNPNTDGRSADHIIEKDELLRNTRLHIRDVMRAMHWFGHEISEQGRFHDRTKVSNIDEFYSDFNASQNGDIKFKEAHWYKDIHMTERHHLDESCPKDVNLFDVLEQIADSTTAGMSRSGYVYEDNPDPEMLIKAYKNTMKLLKKHIEVVDADSPKKQDL